MVITEQYTEHYIIWTG